MSIRWAPWDTADGLATVSRERHRGNELLSRFSVRKLPLAPGIALWTAALAGEFGVLIPVLFDRAEPVGGAELLYRLIGGSFAACGLIAWRRRPDSRVGPLMTAAGFCFFIAPLLGQLDSALAQTLAAIFRAVWAIPLAAVLLGFLTGGRLESGVDRLLVLLFVVSTLILQFVWLLFIEREGNLLGVFPSQPLEAAV